MDVVCVSQLFVVEEVNPILVGMEIEPKIEFGMA